jgi:hypothetical protein
MSSPMFFSFVYGLFASVVDDVVILQFFTLFKAPTMMCFKWVFFINYSLPSLPCCIFFLRGCFAIPFILLMQNKDYNLRWTPHVVPIHLEYLQI